MSTGIETARESSSSRKNYGFLESRRHYTGEDETLCLFDLVIVYHDTVPRSAAMNMAVDEALLEHATLPSIRFYRWQSAALSFGYFGKFADVAGYACARDLVRRWTGGGIVFHGKDLTYSIVIPATDPAFSEASLLIYESIHRALADALNGIGHRAEVVGWARSADQTLQRGGLTNSCFANPVRADVMIADRKIAGAAQRRTRRGLLQQGSIQGFEYENNLEQRFAAALSADCTERELADEILEHARELAQQKYGSELWLKKR